jgi:DNA-binding NarL/FixJ family response regulator
MEDTVRVLIAEDHPLFREGMRGRLDRVADVAVVGEAASGDEAVELAQKLEPDVILMDIKMPGLNGIEATREIQRAYWCSPCSRTTIRSSLRCAPGPKATS